MEVLNGQEKTIFYSTIIELNYPSNPNRMSFVIKKESLSDTEEYEETITDVEGQHVSIKREECTESSLQKPTAEENCVGVKKESTDLDDDISTFVEDIKNEDDITIEPVVLLKRFTPPVIYGN